MDWRRTAPLSHVSEQQSEAELPVAAGPSILNYVITRILENQTFLSSTKIIEKKYKNL